MNVLCITIERTRYIHIILSERVHHEQHAQMSSPFKELLNYYTPREYKYSYTRWRGELYKWEKVYTRKDKASSALLGTAQQYMSYTASNYCAQLQGVAGRNRLTIRHWCWWSAMCLIWNALVCATQTDWVELSSPMIATSEAEESPLLCARTIHQQGEQGEYWKDDAT